MDDAKSLAIRRNLELIPQSNDLWVDLDDRDVGGWQASVAKPGQLAAAKPQYQNATRCRVDQQERHHLSGVVRHDRVRLQAQQCALCGLPRKVQPSLLTCIKDERLRHSVMDQSLPQLDGIGCVGVSQDAHGSLLCALRPRELYPAMLDRLSSSRVKYHQTHMEKS
jgi:hypothetical protein